MRVFCFPVCPVLFRVSVCVKQALAAAPLCSVRRRQDKLSRGLAGAGEEGEEEEPGRPESHSGRGKQTSEPHRGSDVTGNHPAFTITLGRSCSRGLVF